MSERFGALRSILQKTPSEEVWREIVDELALWGEEERDAVALPYVADHLDRWPVEIERGAFEEVELWKRSGVVTPTVRLINAIWLNHPRQLGPLLKSPLVGWVRHVELWIGEVEAEDGAGLAAPLGRLGLVSLTLAGASEAEGLCALIAGLDGPGLRALRVAECGPCGERVAEAIAGNVRLAGLREVELIGAGLGAAGARALARGGRLEALKVDDNPLGYRGAVALAGLPLRSLSAARCGLGPQSVAALAGCAGPLERFVLDGNKIGAGGAQALAARSHEAGLTTLSLGEAGLRAGELRALAASPALARLGSLHVLGNQTAGAEVAIFEGLRALRTLRMEWPREDAGLMGELATRWPPGLEWPLSYGRYARGVLAALAGCEGLANMRRLHLRDPDAAFLESPHLGGVWQLSLSDAGAAALDALCGEGVLRGLRALSISRPAAAIGRALAGRRVEQLMIVDAALDAACVEAICGMGLRGLKLSCCEIEPALLARLLGSEGLEGLETLELFKTGCGDVGAAIIAGNGALAGLKELGLPGEGIGDVGVRALVGSRWLGGLQRLHLEENEIGDAGAAALAGSPLLVRLLGFNGNMIEEQGVLMGNRIGDEGLRALIGSPYIGLMHSLDLRDNAITEAGMAALARDPALAGLKGMLWLSGEAEGEAGRALEESGWLGRGARVRIEAARDAGG